MCGLIVIYDVLAFASTLTSSLVLLVFVVACFQPLDVALLADDSFASSISQIVYDYLVSHQFYSLALFRFQIYLFYHFFDHSSKYYLVSGPSMVAFGGRR